MWLHQAGLVADWKLGLSGNTGMAGFLLSFSIRSAPLHLTPPAKSWTHQKHEALKSCKALNIEAQKERTPDPISGSCMYRPILGSGAICLALGLGLLTWVRMKPLLVSSFVFKTPPL